MSRRLDFGDYHVGTYCGEHLFSLRSWKWWLKKYGPVRTLGHGFSIGPVLFWKERIEKV